MLPILYTCKDGNCGNQCDASSVTTSQSASIGINLAPHIETFKQTVQKLSANKVNVNIVPSFTAKETKGEECCGDCTINNGQPVPYSDYSGTGSLLLGLEAYPGAFKKPIPLAGLTIEIEGTFSAGVGADAKITGSVSGRSSECNDDTCINANLGTTTSMHVGVKAALGLSIISCGSGSNHTADECPVLVGGVGEASGQLSATSSVNITSKFGCEDACGQVSGSVGQLSLSATANYTIRVLHVLRYMGSADVSVDLFGGFPVGPFGNCN